MNGRGRTQGYPAAALTAALGVSLVGGIAASGGGTSLTLTLLAAPFALVGGWSLLNARPASMIADAAAALTRPAAFTMLVLLVISVGRFSILATTDETPKLAGNWVDTVDCPHIACVPSPDSARYVGITTFFNRSFAFGDVGDAVRAFPAAIDATQTKNGIFFGFVSALVMRATGLTALESVQLVALLSGILLAHGMRGYFARHRLPPIPLLLFVLSALIVVYSNVALKETFDALLLFLGLTFVQRPTLARLPLFALATFGLFYDREYYVYVIGGFALVRLVWSHQSTLVRWTAAATVGAMTMYVVFARGINLALLDFYHQALRPGEPLLSPANVVGGPLRTLVSPINPGIASYEIPNAIFNLPLVVGYLLVARYALRAWRQRGTGRLRTMFDVANPYIAVFGLVVFLFGVVYGGHYRARETFSFMLFIGLGHLLVQARTAKAECRPST